MLTDGSQDLEEIEEWNEYGELKQQIGATAGAPPTPTTSTANTPSKPSALSSSADPISTPRSAPMTKPEHISIAEPAEDMRKPSPTAPKKDDTPLTMAMRQAGAEAAAKAGQKKVVKPGSLLSDNPKSPDDPTSPTTAAPIANVKLGKASADPQASTETTAAKIPTKLAAEGAKRTSVDKITDSESSTDVETETPMQRSTEESKLEARRTSSITKQKSALSNETALESSSALGEQAEEPERPSLRTHRGSSVSDASKEEIAGIEKACAIPEEEESEDEQHTSHSAAQRLGFADVTSSSKQEEPATEDTKLPAEDAKAGEGAGVSVGD